MEKNKTKTVTALVTGRSGSKSIKVAIDRKVKHPKYGKYIHTRTILAVHDEHNKAAVGDVVKIAESRPYSKTKSWCLVDIVAEAGQKQNRV